jgi:tripartite-type tricarboxylate transporter receptor subunit TctC
VRSGALRALGVSSAQRNADLPDVPTVAESGYPDYLVSVWFAVIASAKVPDAIAGILKRSLDRALDDDTFRASLQKIGYSVMRPQSAAAITDFIDADRARWSAVIKAQNISLD